MARTRGLIMKIKISKGQWEETGRKAGWMDAYKSIRKPMPKPERIMEDEKIHEKI